MILGEDIYGVTELNIIIAAQQIKNVCASLAIKKLPKIGSFFKLHGC